MSILPPDENSDRQQQARQLVKLAKRALANRRPLFILVQYAHTADKQAFVTEIESLLKPQAINTCHYDPRQIKAHSVGQGVGNLYPLLRKDAAAQTLSLVLSLPEADASSGGADSHSERDDFFSYINLHRDSIARDKLHWVLFLRDSEMADFIDAAGDLWSFRHRTFRLERPRDNLSGKSIEMQGGEAVRPSLESLNDSLAPAAIAQHIADTRQLIDETAAPQEKAQLWLALNRWLVRHQAAQQAIEAAQAGIKALNGQICDCLAELENDLAELLLLLQNGNISSALSHTHARAALSVSRQVDNPALEAISLATLSRVYHIQDKHDKAQGCLQQALDIVRGNDKLTEGKILAVMALWYRDRGDYSQALPLVQRELELDEKVLGPDHADVAASLNNLANLYQAMGDYQQALPLHQRALTIREKALGPDHADVGSSLNNLAALYESMGDYQQALPLYQRALLIGEKALGPDHADVATSLNNLAGLYQAMGDYQQALPLYQRALLIHEKALGPDHADVATSLNNLGLLYQVMGDYQQALPLFERAVGIWQKVFPPEHPTLAKGLKNLARLQQILQPPSAKQ